MRKRLKSRLQTADSVQGNQVYSSYDIVGGNIAIIKVPNGDLENAHKAAKAIMSIYKNLKSVFMQTSPVAGDFRVRQLKLIEGENNAVTLHRESDCVFKVDVQQCYFSPRLQFERSRIANLVMPDEVVVNMFSGVGCFSILIAKKAANSKVYSIDVNPEAIRYMQENVKLNSVNGKVFPMLGDSRDVVNTQLQHVADRVLMPLPEKALEYLHNAVSALKPSGGCIHYYDFEHANSREEALGKTKQKTAEKLANSRVSYNFAFSRIVRSTGPNWYQTVVDIQIKP